MPKIVAEAWISVPIARVFAFFSDPFNLPRLMPPQLLARIEDVRWSPPPDRFVAESGRNPQPFAGPGSLITVSLRAVPLLPFRTLWVAEIVEFVPNSHFRDIQTKGPMKSWSHTHQFRSEIREGADGTLVSDIVDYQLPFGVLGWLADFLLLRWLIKLTFRTRQRMLTQLLR